MNPRTIPLLWCLVLGAAGAAAQPPRLGADLSSLPQVERGGATFAARGETADCLAILRRGGVEMARLRLWHAPPGGSCGLAESLALAERARAAGLDLILDLHYSDTWADPGRQTPPAAWDGLDDDALADSVRIYTRDVLSAFAAHGCPPAIVQLGNEITGGLLWDAGRVGGAFDTPAQWERLAALLRAAVAGLADSAGGSPRPRVMIHLDRGADNAGARWFLDRLVAQGVDFDCIGLSYYPWWHGSLADLRANLDDLAVRYGRDLMIVETAYPWTLQWFDDTHNGVGRPEQLLPGYPATPAGQAAYLAALLEIVRQAPAGRGRAVVWWEPAWIAAPRCGSPWENLAWFGADGEALPVLTDRMDEGPAPAVR